MEYRRLGRSGLFISALTLGTMTFGGRGNFGMVGSTDLTAATRQVDMCLDAGITLFDTADDTLPVSPRRSSAERSVAAAIE